MAGGVVNEWVHAGERYQRLVERVRELGGDRVRVVAVTKTFPVEAVEAVRAVGCDRIGENYANELIAKVGEIDARSPSRPEVHFIGSVQSNKVRHLAAVVDVWQTLDRESVIAEVAARRPGARVLVQVNATAEPNKGGCVPAATEGLVAAALARGLRVEGLMTMGPTHPDLDLTRRAFAATARLAGSLGLADVSMGMSGDWEVAIDEGSTLIRVGSAIFGDRPPAGR